MATSPSRRLKVFQAQFGFFDTVVAAPSQAAALRAWGVNQNLFASGEAKPTTDEAAVAAATAHPETPLRRAVGSSEPFALEPTSLPAVPDGPKKTATKPVAKAKPPKPSRPACGSLKARRRRKGAELNSTTPQSEKRPTSAARPKTSRPAGWRLSPAYVEARKAATSKVVDARTAYRKAGGED